MTGRHAHASGKGASKTGLWLVQFAAIVVGILLALAAVGAVFYYLVTGSNLIVAYSAMSVFWVGYFIWTLVRRRGTFWLWFSASLLLSTISQLITALAHRHEWLAGHPHLTAQLSDWSRWIGLALLGVAVVLGIRSGELLFWRRSRPASGSAEPEE